jgi:hypothetical protein
MNREGGRKRKDWGGGTGHLSVPKILIANFSNYCSRSVHHEGICIRAKGIGTEIEETQYIRRERKVGRRWRKQPELVEKSLRHCLEQVSFFTDGYVF